MLQSGRIVRTLHRLPAWSQRHATAVDNVSAAGSDVANQMAAQSLAATAASRTRRSRNTRKGRLGTCFPTLSSIEVIAYRPRTYA